MVDVTTTIVFSMMFACQEPVKECPAGLNPGDTRRIEFGVYYQNGDKNIVEIYNNDKPVFIMKDDGTVTRDDSFIPDPYALEFWKSMQKNYNLCKFETELDNPFRPKRKRFK